MNRASLIAAGVAALALVAIIYTSFYTVSPTEQVIVLQFGAPRAVETEPGLHVKVPWVQTVAYIDKRLLNVEPPTEEISTQDKKLLRVDAFARWRIVDPIRFNARSPSKDIAVQRLTTIFDSNLRRVLGVHNFSAVFSPQLETLTRDIRDGMNRETGEFGIAVVDVRIRHADLPQLNSDAVYIRMQEERKREAGALRAEGAEIGQRIRARAERQATVILAEATREADILRGEGDAEKTRILGEAFGKDAEFASFYRSLEAYQEALPPSNTTAILSPNSPFFHYFLQAPDTATGPRKR